MFRRCKHERARHLGFGCVNIGYVIPPDVPTVTDPAGAADRSAQ